MTIGDDLKIVGGRLVGHDLGQHVGILAAVLDSQIGAGLQLLPESDQGFAPVGLLEFIRRCGRALASRSFGGSRSRGTVDLGIAADRTHHDSAASSF